MYIYNNIDFYNCSKLILTRLYCLENISALNRFCQKKNNRHIYNVV